LAADGLILFASFFSPLLTAVLFSAPVLALLVDEFVRLADHERTLGKSHVLVGQVGPQFELFVVSVYLCATKGLHAR